MANCNAGYKAGKKQFKEMTGAGKVSVKGYSRGGPVKKPTVGEKTTKKEKC